MNTKMFSLLLGFLAVPALFAGEPVRAPALDGAKWLWHPAAKGVKGTVQLRTAFNIPAGTLAYARFVFTCDDAAKLKLNGKQIAEQPNTFMSWKNPTVVWDLVKAGLKPGRNTLEVAGYNDESFAGFIGCLEYCVKGGKPVRVPTGPATWQVSLNGRDFGTPCVTGAYGDSPWGRMADDLAYTGPGPMCPFEGKSVAHASEWIQAADAPVADRATQGRQLAAPGTSWFTRAFTNKKPVARATWAVSGLGVFEAYVNGARVGGLQALKPGFTHGRKTKHYFLYDVTPHLALKEGDTNTLAAEVSAGWWRDQIVRYVGRHSAFRAELFVRYTDGTFEVIPTRAGEWQAGVGGPVLRAGIFDGELHDARIAPPVKGAANFKPAVSCTEFGGGTFPYEGAEIVRRFDLALKPVEAYCWKGVTGADPAKKIFGTVAKTRTFKPGETLAVAPGETLVLDFAQNAAAVPNLQFAEAAAGTQVTCLFAEMLNDGNGERSRGNDGPRGALYRENLRMASQGMRLEYTCNGTAQESYFPRFTFFGYRYMSVTATAPVKFTVTSVPVTSITKEMELGQIETGDKDVNRLIQNVYWGQLSNYLSVPTDCPQRNERLGWTADTQVFTEAGTFNANTARFFHKWMRDMRDTRHPKGGFTGVAPLAQYGSDPMRLGWSDAGVIVPYQIWKQFNDTAIVEENWDAMAKYVARCAETKFEHTAIRNEAHDFQWADWLSYEGVPHNLRFHYWDYMGACYWLWNAQMMGTMATATGRTAEAAKYAAMAQEATAYIKKTFLNADGTFQLDALNRMQTPALFALKSKFFDGAAKEALIARLRKNFKDHGDCLQTGFLGTSILMDTLTENGMSDVAYTLLLQHKNPSWLYSVDQGATTIWERWNSYTKERGFGPVGMNSFNHYAYGAVLAWIYKSVAGIAADPAAPGFKVIVMAPQPDRRLGSVKARYRTQHGLVTSAWRYEGAKWIWEFTVPEGATARVTVPGATASEIYKPGSYKIVK